MVPTFEDGLHGRRYKNCNFINRLEASNDRNPGHPTNRLVDCCVHRPTSFSAGRQHLRSIWLQYRLCDPCRNGRNLHAVCGHRILGDVEGCITPRPRQARCQECGDCKGLPEGGANTRTTSTPPFDGNFVEVPLDEADPDFVKVAKDVFYGNSESGDNFTAAVQSVFRSTPGRPSWYFLLNTSDGRSSWLKVPHAGRRGAGAGVPGK